MDRKAEHFEDIHHHGSGKVLAVSCYRDCMNKTW